MRCVIQYSIKRFIESQHQYTVNNTQFWLNVWVLPNNLQASIYYMEVHSVCTYIVGSHKGKGKVHLCTGNEALYTPYGP